MVGALCGATNGAQPLPAAWVDRLGVQAIEAATNVAEQLAHVAREKASQYLQDLNTVPGLTPGSAGA
jgi:hypothetical protein